MDESIFKEIGLTNAESKIYLALLKTGQTTAGPLLEKTGLQNSTFHKTIHKLITKGFASYIIKGKTHYYHAVEPENILKLISEKEKKFMAIMPELKILQKPIDKQTAEVFEGFNGFKNMTYELIENANKGDEYLYFAFLAENHPDYEKVYAFYTEFEKERSKKGIIVKGIVPSKIKEMYKKRNQKNILYVDFPILTNISIFQDKVYFTPWDEKEVSFLIQSKQFADSFRQYFYSIWNKYKKD